MIYHHSLHLKDQSVHQCHPWNTTTPRRTDASKATNIVFILQSCVLNKECIVAPLSHSQWHTRSDRGGLTGTTANLFIWPGATTTTGGSTRTDPSCRRDNSDSDSRRQSVPQPKLKGKWKGRRRRERHRRYRQAHGARVVDAGTGGDHLRVESSEGVACG